MDYEKAYKETLERAKKEWSNNLDNAYKNYRERLEIIFPELKESDDEKTRKALISFLKSPFVDENITDEKVAPWLAWLEKQGEQKPTTVDIDKMVDDYANRRECGNEEFGKPLPCMIRAYKQGLNDAIRKVALITAWSEEDETSIAINNPEAYRIGFADGKAHAEEEMAIAWLEKQGQVKENQILQHEGTHEGTSCKENDNSLTRKPRFKVKYAGSEYNVFEIREFAGDTHYGIEDEPNHIDYVFPDNCEIISEQNPNWSEKDERFLNQTIEEVDYALNDKDMFYNGYSPLIDWLKDLKQRLGGE